MKRLALLLFMPLLILLFAATRVLGISLEECEKDPSSNVNECIDLFSGKIEELGTQKKTLTSQIVQYDTQIKVTQLKIADAQKTINQLEKEIGVLYFRIGYVSQNINSLEKLVKKRIVATYQQGFISNLELILASNDFSDLILKLQYLKQVQENDKRILASLQQTKSNYANQKDEREEKQAAIEANKNKLEILEVSLDQQKAEKQALLDVTKNDETRYQRLLSQAQAVLAVAFGGGTEAFLRDVNANEVIGSIARHDISPGCSSGGHLHFEVHKDGTIQDPNNYLKSATINYSYQDNQYGYFGTVNPQGDLPWPVNEPIYINQGFGTSHGYAAFYGSSGHTGIDIQTGSDSGAGDQVKTVKDGKLYGGSYQCAGVYPGTLLYSRVKHDDGLDTLYLHMVPN